MKENCCREEKGIRSLPANLKQAIGEMAGRFEKSPLGDHVFNHFLCEKMGETFLILAYQARFTIMDNDRIMKRDNLVDIRSHQLYPKGISLLYMASYFGYQDT